MTRPFLIAAIILSLRVNLPAADYPLVPRLVGNWWTIATDPDLGALSTPKQQPVDFGIWQASDGTWQLWSCIRGTKEPGKTRLFHRWEGAQLTDTNWTPKGIALHADPALGETQGGLQAPYVMRHDGKYWMFYGDWANICLATSTDGKTFTRHKNADGKPQLNFIGPPGFMPASAISTSVPGWHFAAFASPLTISAGARYGLVLYEFGSSSSGYVDFGSSTRNPYPNGRMMWESAPGEPLSPILPDFDLAFQNAVAVPEPRVIALIVVSVVFLRLGTQNRRN